ncbi:MAG: hypothetical protein AAFZ52_18370, partial [Bacteroidota bacterium]
MAQNLTANVGDIDFSFSGDNNTQCVSDGRTADGTQVDPGTITATNGTVLRYNFDFFSTGITGNGDPCDYIIGEGGAGLRVRDVNQGNLVLSLGDDAGGPNPIPQLDNNTQFVRITGGIDGTFEPSDEIQVVLRTNSAGTVLFNQTFLLDAGSPFPIVTDEFDTGDDLEVVIRLEHGNSGTTNDANDETVIIDQLRVRNCLDITGLTMTVPTGVDDNATEAGVQICDDGPSGGDELLVNINGATNLDDGAYEVRFRLDNGSGTVTNINQVLDFVGGVASLNGDTDIPIATGLAGTTQTLTILRLTEQAARGCLANTAVLPARPEISFFVSQAPEIASFSSNDISVCAESMEGFSFTATSTGGIPLSYELTGDIVDANNASNDIGDVTFDMATGMAANGILAITGTATYDVDAGELTTPGVATLTLTVTDDNGCIDVEEIMVTVNPLPTEPVIEQPNDPQSPTAICTDYAEPFMVSLASQQTGIQYSWLVFEAGTMTPAVATVNVVSPVAVTIDFEDEGDYLVQ